MSKVEWPAWYYGPNNQAEVFESEALVPKGWVNHPSKLAATEKGEANSVELDASGTAWDEAMHSPTKTKTSAGLWRMKVGVSRPVRTPLDL